MKKTKRRKSYAEKYAVKECKRMYDTLLKFTARINAADNPSSKGLDKEQVKALVRYVIDVLSKKHEGGSYRYLIYTVLKGVAYCDGMEMGLLELNNVLFDIMAGTSK